MKKETLEALADSKQLLNYTEDLIKRIEEERKELAKIITESENALKYVNILGNVQLYQDRHVKYHKN